MEETSHHMGSDDCRRRELLNGDSALGKAANPLERRKSGVLNIVLVGRPLVVARLGHCVALTGLVTRLRQETFLGFSSRQAYAQSEFCDGRSR
jgi:hypothetical protein